MKTVEMLLIHGTGGRRDGFTRMLDQAQALFPEDDGGRTIQIEALPWGEIGSKLHANGASVPGYKDSGGGQVHTKPEDTEAYDDALWRVVFRDPYYELELERIAPRKAGPGEPAGKRLWKRFVELNLADFHEKLKALEIDSAQFDAVHQAMKEKADLAEWTQKVPAPVRGLAFTFARALIAGAAGRTTPAPVALFEDEKRRDELLNALADAIAANEAGIADWVKKTMGGLVMRAATEFYVLPRRGAASDPLSTFFADIITYQGTGARFRELCRDYLKKQTAGDDVVRVILAHSLGGIIAFETLIAYNKQLQEEGRGVDLFITFGSQSPLFYEWDALETLRYGDPLPAHFPRWVNIYDPRDVLAYIGEQVFPNARDKMKDVVCNNQQHVGLAHTTYLDNKQVQDKIREEIAATG